MVPTGFPRIRTKNGTRAVRPLLFVLLTAAACGDAPAAEDEIALGPTDGVPPGYVGNEACAPCHADIYDEYQGTKKNRSLVPFDPSTAPERFEPSDSVHNELLDLHYRAFLRDGMLVQREWRTTPDGRLVHDLEFSADLVIGSGNQTRSYLMVRNGRVTQMPLTWYTHGEFWAMSPGYDEANDRFSRMINLDCLTCHGDVAVRTPGTQNHYSEVPGAISCERCHGPGEEHVARWSEGPAPSDAPTPSANDGADPTITNPTRLDRDRELSVCNQCHMAGVMSYAPGEGPATFLPGTHLAEHRAVYVPEFQLIDPEWVGIDSHPVRLARSACFQGSEMTCTTCHLPHTPDDQLPPDHFNTQCLSCHADGDHVEAGICARPGLEPGEDPLSGDCVSCHMQGGGTTDVPHVRFTDHWIRREIGPPLDPDAGRPVIESPEPLRLVPLSPRGELASPELYRDLSESQRLGGAAEALFHFFETMHRHPGYLPEVVELGRRSLEEGSGTAEGRLALGRALLGLDSVAAAEEVFREVVEADPENPWPVFLLGSLLEERAGRVEEGIRFLRRALELQPEFQEARRKLAEALYAAGRREEARAELEEVVRRDPIHEPRAWFNLAIVRMELGDEDAAEDAFREASRLDPDLVMAHVHLGSIELARGNLEDAERAFLAAVTADPEEPSAHGSLALVHLERSEWNEAKERLERVLELDPGNQDARTLLEELERQIPSG